jgi:hypothetical protein
VCTVVAFPTPAQPAAQPPAAQLGDRAALPSPLPAAAATAAAAAAAVDVVSRRCGAPVANPAEAAPRLLMRR